MKTTMNLLAAGMFVAASASPFAQSTFTRMTDGPIVNDGGSSFACAWGDFNNDGFLDLFVTNTSDPVTGQTSRNFLYQNNRDGTFARLAEGIIANDLEIAWYGCSWVDFDSDGHLDLLATGGSDLPAEQTVLYRNTGSNTFTRMPPDTLGGVVPRIVGSSPAAVWGDYDRDGFLDVFVNRQGVNWLFRNNGNGGFSRVTNNLEGDPSEDGWSAGWVDFNNDGRPDLFATVISDPGTPHLYSNLGGGLFQEVTSSGITTNLDLCFGSAWADYDNDGFLDLLLVNQLKGKASFLYHNNGNGTFTRMSSSTVGSIASDPGGFSFCAWGDYDNDGFLDVILTATSGLGEVNSEFDTTGGNALYHNDGDGSFTRILTGPPVEDIASSVGCTWADYDNDGFLDLFIANGGVVRSENNALYHNSGNGNNWIKVRCVGTVSNRSAIGAKVRAKATIHGKPIWQLREINSGNGTCQTPLETHFGLADAVKVETLRIEWPSGIVQEFPDLPTKQSLTITEPPRLQALDRLADGSFQLSLTGGVGFGYELQRSNDLAQWTLWTTLTNTSPTMTITDSSVVNVSQSFYRAVSR